jgi:collagenase-like PrtC family protease
MTRIQHPLELLAPAKNADFGIEAIKHGADAVYIGGPAFGARYGAGNDVGEIARLCDFAHRYRAKVFVALNTILHDSELEGGRRNSPGKPLRCRRRRADHPGHGPAGGGPAADPAARQHADRHPQPDKARFLEERRLLAGRPGARTALSTKFSTLHRKPLSSLEYFVHGALCVAYSGQCYISHAHTGRSANRGECSQACRLPYTLVDDKGKDDHREPAPAVDEGQQPDRQHAGELAQAGVSSFKIEGRLKDLSYVKNITAHYRKLLDEIIAEHPEFTRASSGRSTFTFTPQPDKTFNRGYTDYFAGGRQDDIGAFDSPAFVGELIGEVAEIGDGWLVVNTDQTFHNGDGVCFHDAHGEVAGMRINRVEGNKLFPGRDAGRPDRRRHPLPQPRPGIRTGAGKGIGRPPRRRRARSPKPTDGFALTLTDEDGVTVTVDRKTGQNRNGSWPRIPSGMAKLKENLGKFGNTMFVAEPVELQLSQPWFLPVSAINALRREATEARSRPHRQPPAPAARRCRPPTRCPTRRRN